MALRRRSFEMLLRRESRKMPLRRATPEMNLREKARLMRPKQVEAYLQQAALVQRYLGALHSAQYAQAYQLLNRAAQAYYRNADNFASVFAADSYRLAAFQIVRSGNDAMRGRVFFVRESVRFRDHAHDVDLGLTASVPVGVVREHDAWRIKDPGHPWRAFATHASVAESGVRLRVKKVSFFAGRVETVVEFENFGSRFVTILAYGKSIVHDAAGRPCRIIETRDWSLTDKTLFEGLRLAPHARYTGALSFACEYAGNITSGFTLTVAPLLRDGGDMPFALRVAAIRPAPRAE